MEQKEEKTYSVIKQCGIVVRNCCGVSSVCINTSFLTKKGKLQCNEAGVISNMLVLQCSRVIVVQ